MLGVLAGCRQSSTPPSPSAGTGASGRSGPDESLGGDLLGRHPDALLAQPGTLVPDDSEQWGANGLGGWEGHTWSLAGGSWKAVWMRRTHAGLLLPALGPAPRTLRLEVCGPRGAEARTRPLHAVLRLGGAEVGGFDVPAEKATLTVETPASVWRAGANALEIEVDRLAADEDGRPVGLALGSLAYDRRVAPELDPTHERLVLASGTGVSYRFEELGPSAVHLAASAPTPGRLSLVWRRIDPRRGAAQGEEEPLVIPVPGGTACERSLPLPPANGALLELSLAWSAEDGAAALSVGDLRRVLDPPRELPPIVYVCIDTLAARNLSVYGYERDTTPNLRRFAEQAVVFDRCITNAPWTMPSIFSTMTGLWPAAHRLKADLAPGTEAEPWESWYLAPNRWTLAESLRACGYRTGGFAENTWLTPRYGFPQGFDRYDFSACRFEPTDPAGGTRYVAERALSWIDELPHGSPFFLFFHTFDVHGPYSPQPPWKGRFRDDALFRAGRQLPAGGMHNTFGSVPRYVLEAEYPGETPATVDSARVRAAYDEGVAMVDQMLADFFQELRARGIFDRALIVVTADHGETMERGPYYFGHGVLEEEVLHVPLLVRFPDGAHGGMHVKDTVQLVDLYPTLLEFTGVDVGSRGLAGRSLLPLVRGESLPPALVYTQGGIERQAAVERNGWRLVVRAPAELSSDEVLLTDPGVPREFLSRHFPELLDHPLDGALFERLRARAGFSAALAELRGSMAGSEQRLVHVADDPLGEDHAADRPKKVAHLREELATCAAQQLESQKEALPPTDLVELPPEDVDRLRALGYAGD